MYCKNFSLLWMWDTLNFHTHSYITCITYYIVSCSESIFWKKSILELKSRDFIKNFFCNEESESRHQENLKEIWKGWSFLLKIWHKRVWNWQSEMWESWKTSKWRIFSGSVDWLMWNGPLEIMVRREMIFWVEILGKIDNDVRVTSLNVGHF